MLFDLKNEYMEEIWKDVKGYEELYQVSNYGQIRSVDRTVGYRYKGKQRIYKGRMSIPGCAIVSGDTPKKEREHILEAFKAGEIPVVANVGVLTTGFDYPELDTVVMARPTMSLAMWYQIVGRAIRPHPSKECGWIVDLCGNIKRFGEVSDLRLFDSGNGKWAVFSNGRQLTNVRF